MSSQYRQDEQENRESGHNIRKGKRLYKNPDKAKICGVCAGLAEYFEFETWVVRLIVFSFLLFSSGAAFIAYFVACFILDPKPGSKSNRGCFGREKKRHQDKESEKRQYSPSVKEVWKKGDAPSVTLGGIEQSFAKMEQELQKMESFVTSKKYQLDKELSKMG